MLKLRNDCRYVESTTRFVPNRKRTWPCLDRPQLSLPLPSSHRNPLNPNIVLQTRPIPLHLGTTFFYLLNLILLICSLWFLCFLEISRKSGVFAWNVGVVLAIGGWCKKNQVARVDKGSFRHLETSSLANQWIMYRPYIILIACTRCLCHWNWIALRTDSFWENLYMSFKIKYIVFSTK